MGIEAIISLGVVVVTALLAIGGFIWVQKNQEIRLKISEERLTELDKRVNQHDVLFEVLKLDLEYMKKGIDDLRAGQTRLEEQHLKEMRAIKKEK